MIKEYLKALTRVRWGEFNLLRFVTIVILFVGLQLLSTVIDGVIIQWCEIAISAYIVLTMTKLLIYGLIINPLKQWKENKKNK